MRTFFIAAVFLSFSFQQVHAQLLKKPKFSGVYLQWGYNREWYSKNDIHFTQDNEYDFTIHDVTAQDRPDFQAFWETPLDITIPQNSFRIGVYLNAEHTHAIEFNFDHAKYVMDDFKVRRVSGRIYDHTFDKDTLVTPRFVQFEHTNGANFYHINYVGQMVLTKNKKRTTSSFVYKLGAGLVVPKSDVQVMGKQLDNRVHVAGYIISAETGLRYYPFKNFFLEATVKGGFANYLNVLTVEGGKASHKFYYVEVIGLVGYDLNFLKKRKKEKQPE